MDLLSTVPASRRRAARFLGVTAVTAGLGQFLILIFFAGFGWPPLVANLVAVLMVSIVGFFLSVGFVWTDSDPSARGVQISVFLAMTMLGLLISSGTVRFVTDRWDHLLAANLGSVLGFGVAWVMRFAVLERFVFRTAHA